MQRSYFLRGLAVAIGLLGTQCLDSISDDCTKTLTCPDEPQPRLLPNCEWEYPDGRPWLGAPSYDRATSTWRWPDGKPTDTQDFDCDLGLADAGVDGGSTGPGCRDNTQCDEGQVCDGATGDCVQCVSDAECAGNMPTGDAGAATVCDTATHRCVECLSSDNCSGDTDVCKIDAANSRRNACVECLADDHCNAPTPICDDRSNECTSRCQTSGDCATGDKKACNTELRICVECTDNSQCTTSGKSLCDTESNLCVECLDDGQCAASGKVCDLESHSCVECKADAQCTAGPNAALLPFCDLEAKQCVQCLNDVQCTNGTASRCNVAHVCTGCTDGSQCENGYQCRSGECVECLGDADCTNGERCETVSGTCVECFDTSQCTSADAARCETSPSAPGGTRYTCVGCTQNSDCTGNNKGLPGLCDLDRGGICVDCTGQGASPECSDNAALSRCQNGACAVCVEDDDCNLFAEDNRPACKSGVGCVECTESADCTDTQATPVCKLAAGGGPAAINTCVQCLTNADCRTNAGAALCQNNQCVPCQADADCTGVDSNGNAAGGTPLNVCDAGTCVQCTGPKNGACSNATNVCNSTTKQCTNFPVGSADLCETCVADNHCAATQRCASHLFGTTPLGPFCFPVATGAASNTCNLTPYSGLTASTTIDGVSASLCMLRRTTCAGLADFNVQACDAAADCGAEGLDDGRCDEDAEICSVPCTTNVDCFDPDTNSCLGGLCQL